MLLFEIHRNSSHKKWLSLFCYSPSQSNNHLLVSHYLNSHVTRLQISLHPSFSTNPTAPHSDMGRHRRGHKFDSNTKMMPQLPPLDPKDKVAPRSRYQYKVGPPFETTLILQNIYSATANDVVIPRLSARIDRGFDFVDSVWIGYKRNYFSLVAAFELCSHPGLLLLQKDKLYIDGESGREFVRNFNLQICCECSSEEIDPLLVQHTAKRDRGPIDEPTVFVAVPGELPSHQVIRESSNIRNGSKIKELESMLFLEKTARKNCNPNSMLADYPAERIATVARYERIQFSTNLSPRRFDVAGDFFLQVELAVTLMNGNTVTIATTTTPPLIVRGRSPSSYISKAPPRRQKRIQLPLLPSLHLPTVDHTAIVPTSTCHSSQIPKLDIYSHHAQSDSSLSSAGNHIMLMATENDTNTPFMKSFVNNVFFSQENPEPCSEFIDTALLQHLALAADHQVPSRTSALNSSPIKATSCIQPEVFGLNDELPVDDDLLEFQEELNFMRATLNSDMLEYSPPVSGDGWL